MYTVTRTERVGEWVAEEIDWSHHELNERPTSMPDNGLWEEYVEQLRELEMAFKSGKECFVDIGTMTSRRVVKVGMYDGWPYWRPHPTILREGPMGPNRPERSDYTQIRSWWTNEG